ncbi:hypothetical protein HHO41_18650 [Bacillus sp. DNRA2]|uniref:hypothetical protein n=1 Tax=Bacillus sp. DNRA2 TaxID=2723053 RepID=UPI00145D7D8B|nr:hypothetical protein [Bacillus sp. DNRA2]NMD72292.1 hypothetical protein [Bacillus sp. DNRA2]
MALKTSVNIKFDVGNDEFIRSYIPSPSHTEALKGILNGFENNANRSHIVIGPYGTGKSLLATVVSSIVSESTPSIEIQKLINKFQHFDDYIAGQIESVYKLNRKYIPVLLTGNEGRFRDSILSSIIKTLKKTIDIDIILPGISEKIIDSINKWKENYPHTYDIFVKALDSKGKDIENWLLEIKNQNEGEIVFFSKLYPSLTSGASFEIGYNDDIITQMEFLSKKLEEQNVGVFIIYDEFGRFLQGLEPSKLNEAMQDIQDFAEIVSRSNTLQLLLITHKSLRQYFKGSSEVSKEFQRIEKRFTQYHISSDQITFLKIAEVILTENIINKPSINKEQFNITLDKMKNFTLFPSLNPIDREEKIIKAMYPMHPVSLFLLPNLSGVFGQNERTLFTFLESEETGGLKNHMYKSNDYYKPYQLFDYFFPDLNDLDVDYEIREHLLMYKKALARVPDDIKYRQLGINTLKFITLWNICGLQNEQKISNDFLSFAMEKDQSELLPLTKKLSEHKVIRFNRVNNYWEVNTGSAINLQERIEKRKNKIDLKHNDILSILNQNLKSKYFFPEEYNDVKEMTRFAKVELILGNELSRLNVEVINKSDVTIIYILPRENSEINEIKDTINSLSLKKNVIFAIHSVPLSTIMDDLLESFIILDLLNDKSLLAEDKGIKEELILMSKEVSHVVSEYLSVITEFDGKTIWITNKTETRVENKISLSNLLSKICFEIYTHTPVILNDSFNRINITSAQRKAAISVVNSIITSPREEYFGIEGNGPDYAIFASIFKRNGNLYKNVNTFDYKNIEDQSYKLIRDKLIKLLDSNPKGSFADILNIFTNTPFGIRKPIIPILLVSMLRDRWNEFMLYRNEMYISGLNGDILFEILYEEGPENYHYVYEKFDEEYIEFFSYIEEVFKDHIEERLDGKSRLIKTCGTLLKWLRSLPRLTQLTDETETDFKVLRDLIRKTEVKPQESIADIYHEFFKNNNRDKLFLLKIYAERYLDIFKDNLLTNIFDICEVETFDSLKVWATTRHEYFKKNNKLIKVLLGLYNVNWLNKFIENYIGVELRDWSDTTNNLFFNQLSNDYHDAINFIENIEEGSIKDQFITVDFSGKKKIISKVKLSPKAETIYKNVNRMIQNGGKSIPKKEIEYMIYKLFEKHVE